MSAADTNAPGTPDAMGVYLHLPWCVRKCPYCDFNSHVARGTLPQQQYVAALERDLCSSAAPLAGRQVRTIFIGGGTPSLFTGESIGAILSALARQLNVARDAEITLEANPGAVEAGRFEEFRAAGVNRLSLGAQSFFDPFLKALGRIHCAAEIEQALTTAKAAGFANINLDLMYGLPGQTVDQALADVAKALEAGGVKQDVLRNLIGLVETGGRRIVLGGFTDYAKHLINLFSDRIVAVWDERPEVANIAFRDVPVVFDLPEETDQVIATRFVDLYHIQRRLLTEGHPHVTFSYPPTLDGHSTKTLITHLQTPFLQQLLSADGVDEAAGESMMTFDKIVFVVELLRSVAHRPGDVAEIGVWQGGSAYFSLLLLWHNSRRTRPSFYLTSSKNMIDIIPKGS